jgi:glycerol-3-phosphate responsive antiterminator
MQDLRDCFREHPVIASIRNDTDFKYALNSKVVALFILYGDIFNLPQIIKECKKHNKLVFLHMDLIAPYFIEHVYKELLCPVIAGGLISDKSEIEELFQKGVLAVSTSRKELW